MESIRTLPKPPTAAKPTEILDELDQEIGETPAAKQLNDLPTIAMPGPQEIKAGLQEILPTIVYDTFEPLIATKLQAQSEALSEKLLRQSTDNTLATIRTALGETTRDLKLEILKETRTQAETLDKALISHVMPSILKDVNKRLAVISSQLRKDLKSDIETISSQLIEDQMFIASIQSAIAPKIESKILEVSRAHAKSTAKETAEEIGLAGFSNATHSITPKLQTLNRKINQLAIGAALVGIVSAAVVYLLPPI